MLKTSLIALALLQSSLCFAQTGEILIGKPAPVVAKAGATLESKLAFDVRQGFHIQSNTPPDPYLIPLRLTWNPGPLTPSEVVYPKPQIEKYGFWPTPLSVFSGTVEITTRWKVPGSVALGTVTMTGKLRYQACNDRECKTPKTIDVSLPVTIVR